MSEFKFEIIQQVATACLLGESPLWHDSRQSWFWSDILNKTIYELPYGTVKPRLITSLPQMISNICVIDDDNLLVSAENSIARLSIKDGTFSSLCTLPHDGTFRCNDGSIGPDGNFWFGSMQKSPKSLSGRIYRFDASGRLTLMATGIGIPNTFVWDEDGALIVSDSLERKTFKVKNDNNEFDWTHKSTWLHYTNGNETPDGGAAFAEPDKILLAIWGGSRLDVINNGKCEASIECPMPHVTSCAFGGENLDEILVTSAQQGMNIEEINRTPFAGGILIVKSDKAGKLIPHFTLR